MLLDNLANCNRWYRTAFLTALGIILLAGMYNWIICPHTNALFAAQQRESALKNFADKNENMASVVEAKKQELKELNEKLSQLHSILFTKKEAKEFFSDLQPISEELGCMVNSLNLLESPSKEGDNAGIVAEGAILSVYGVYSNVIRLVERLQGRTQKVWIDSLKMQSLDYESSQIKCELNLIIYTIANGEVIFDD